MKQKPKSKSGLNTWISEVTPEGHLIVTSGVRDSPHFVFTFFRSHNIALFISQI